MLTNKIIKGFTQGFKLDFVGERKSSFAPNLLSAREFPGVIDSKVALEVALGRIAGPFNTPPMDPLWVSPVGVVPKKIKGEYRMIQHLSYPKGSSVNDGIPRERSTVHYATVDDAISSIKKMREWQCTGKNGHQECLSNHTSSPFRLSAARVSVEGEMVC